MVRATMIEQLNAANQWDLVIIGGGATGVGSALDAAARGYKTLLIEGSDFAKGTSSRSTKLVHGGVRYLQQGNIKLVREALRERGNLLKNAPHLTSVQPFIVPVFSVWEKLFYGFGLKFYDLLSGKLSLGKTSILSARETIQKFPSINKKKLLGGILYYDGQFDDSQLVIEIAATASNKGATILNYFKATGFIKTAGKITAVQCTDTLTNETYEIKTKAVINATGVFTNSILQMDDAINHNLVSPSQGTHLVINSNFFPTKDAMMIPKTDDGRVLFAVPWKNKIIIGTTDTPINTTSLEPKALEEEIDFLITHINRYNTIQITRNDVNSIYVGLRPLVKQKYKVNSALISREHHLNISKSGLVTITGGKWTTYRKMAADAVDNACFSGKLIKQICTTSQIAIGNLNEKIILLQSIIKEDSNLNNRLDSNYEFTKADVVFAVKHEMAMTIEDVLARRNRLLFLDAKVAIQVAPIVASIMAKYLSKEKKWEMEEVENFTTMAKQYILVP